jgi:vitamin K-dependent gamma-carboxylase
MVLLRYLVGPIVILHLWRIAHATLYLDTFHQPYASWYPELPRGAYVALLWIGIAAGVGMLVRPVARAATIVAFTVVTYDLFVSTTEFHNNRAYLWVVLGCLCFVPGDTGPSWPLSLLRAEATCVYAGSGLSKLFDRDWFSGRVSWGRMLAAGSNVPHWLTNRELHTYAAKVIIATELFIAVGLWFRRSRPFAIAAAVVFHIAIAFTADVEVFSILGIAALVIWLPPQWVVAMPPSTGITAPVR